ARTFRTGPSRPRLSPPSSTSSRAIVRVAATGPPSSSPPEPRHERRPGPTHADGLHLAARAGGTFTARGPGHDTRRGAHAGGAQVGWLPRALELLRAAAPSARGRSRRDQHLGHVGG